MHWLQNYLKQERCIHFMIDDKWNYLYDKKGLIQRKVVNRTRVGRGEKNSTWVWWQISIPNKKKQVKFKLRRGLQTKEYKFRIPLTEFWKSMLVLQEGITISEIQKDINYFAFYLKCNQIVVEYEIVNRHIFNTFRVPDFKDYGQFRWTLALSVSRKLGLFNYFFCFFHVSNNQYKE